MAEDTLHRKLGALCGLWRELVTPFLISLRC